MAAHADFAGHGDGADFGRPDQAGRIKQALGGANGDPMIFISRPISAVMVGAMILLIGFTIRGALKGRKKREDGQINDT